MPTIAYPSYPDLQVPGTASKSALRNGIRNVAVQATAVVAALSREMSFIEHLEELRRRLLWAAGFLAVAFLGCWFFWADLYEIARAAIDTNTAATLTITRPQDIFSLQLRVSMVTALFVSSPFILAQAWLFISPGLYPHERRYAVPFVLSCSVLFLAGGVFGYFVAFPMTLGFLLDMIVDAQLTPIIDAIEYFKLLFNILVALGVVFQLPAVVFVLSRIGLVDARLLVRNAQYALLIGMIIAAVITPPDLGSMAAVVVPMALLYVLSIAVAWLFGRKRRIA